jgi:hypothetical protein
VRFRGVSRQGEFKNTIKIFFQKVHVENFFQKNRQKFRCQFFLDFFCFITFSGVSQQGEFKNTIKLFWQKVHVENFFEKNRKRNNESDVDLPQPKKTAAFFYRVQKEKVNLGSSQKNAVFFPSDFCLSLGCFARFCFIALLGVS